MNLDIENIDSINQQIWRSIYEVIHDDYFKAVTLFPTQFLDHCKKMNLQTYQIKSKQLKKIATKQGLYAQFFMIHRRKSSDKKEKGKTKKYKPQVQSARTKHWFDLDHEWLKENFMTREPDFYKKIYQTKFRGDNTKTYQIFGVIIGNAKMTRNVQFHLAEPLIKYHKNTYNSCFLSSLALIGL